MFADRIAVLYLGRVVEEGPAADVIGQPQHPYTRALVSVIPSPSRDAASSRQVLRGEIPDAAHVPSGCAFHPRCPLYRERGEPEVCRTMRPTLAGAGGHVAACHLIKE
jgi:oligopeptide/dipeptide ABC transporter ATP-binding protein